MKKAHTSPEYWVSIIRQQGLKLTPARREILSLLTAKHQPMSIQDLAGMMRHKKADQATLYRSLEAFADAGIVKRIDFHHGHTHYELDDQARHHHHIVCQRCGLVEDIDASRWIDLSKVALKQSKRFVKIRDHAIEFFGLCRTCSRSATS